MWQLSSKKDIQILRHLVATTVALANGPCALPLCGRLLQYIDAHTHQGSCPMFAAAESPNADAGNIRSAQIRLHTHSNWYMILKVMMKSNDEKQWWNKYRQMS